MAWEALGSAVIGFVLAYAAMRRLPRRLPARPLVLSTGPAAALLGTLLTHAVLGPGHTAATLVGAIGFTVAILSLLIRPESGLRRSVPA
ncbi:hypothetical protein E4099_10290 [Streptomyces palmae]|uniref:Integral membrane protein n=1 Tax=Streptomyces palmae TaxID=1701085 RepID=A0A4Z0H8U0_9ACTN|nr:hypothetical protein E4099_10290 [Streptomyces palmae]